MIPPEIAETFAVATVAQRLRALQAEAEPLYRLAAALSVRSDALDAEEIMQAWDAAAAFADRDPLALQVLDLLDERVASDPVLTRQIARDYPLSLAGPGGHRRAPCIYVDGEARPSFIERVAELEREGATAYAGVDQPGWWHEVTPARFIAAWDAASVVADHDPEAAPALRALRSGICQRPQLLESVRRCNPRTLAVQEFARSPYRDPSSAAAGGPVRDPPAREIATFLHADFPRPAAQRPQPGRARPGRSLPYPLPCTRAIGHDHGSGR
ncbi:MAG: hypothetical protein ACRDJU_12595 [Actinomycetota bacterium]